VYNNDHVKYGELLCDTLCCSYFFANDLTSNDTPSVSMFHSINDITCIRTDIFPQCLKYTWLFM
jgi:hypothetical protein